MILIADGGSTKTHWCLVDKNSDLQEFKSEGYNPYFVNADYIQESLLKALPPTINPVLVEKIHFYGAGVHGKEKVMILQKAFQDIFINAEIFIEHDLLASCRALLGNQPGFAAILGTGTNTCLYNGSEIVHQVDSAAYILGDEGSGCYIGKKLLVNYLRGTLPPAVRENFERTYTYRHDDILNKIYTQPLANRFCASFSEFAFNNIDDKHIYNIVESSINDFFTQLVSLYPEYTSYKFNAVGSVAFYFSNILEGSAQKYNMKIGKIIQSPIYDLIDFHKRHMAQ
jgi:N-acetylglucosamine kinase-like BadF-type ATPase